MIVKKTAFYIVIVIFVGLSNYSNCQEQIESSRLVTFLEQNTDTTIIFYYPPNSWVRYTDQLIISKQGDNLVFSSYVNPYKHYSFEHKPPEDQLGKKFIAEEKIFEKTVPDTNRYFLPKDVNPSLRDSAWRAIIRFSPWALKDTISPEIEQKYWVYDAGGISLLLITKDSIKKIVFYDPWDFQQYEPGKTNRKTILKIEKIFDRVFGKR